MPKSDHAYFQLVAENFLRNISLDGTHRDTALRIFQTPQSCQDIIDRDLDHVTARAQEGLEKDHVVEYARAEKARNSADEKRRRVSRNFTGLRSSFKKLRKGDVFRKRVVSLNVSSSFDVDISHSSNKATTNVFKKLSRVFLGSPHPQRSVVGQNQPPNWRSTDLVYSSRESLNSPQSKFSTATKRLALAFSQHSSTAKESEFSDQEFRPGKVCFCYQQTPVVVFSVLPPSGWKKPPQPQFPASSGGGIFVLGDILRPIHLNEFQEISYDHLLSSNESDSSPSPTTAGPSYRYDQGSNYRDFLQYVESETTPIDNKHKTTLTLASMISTIIEYIDPDDVKKEINEGFRRKFPQIRLTYSKYQSLRRELRKTCIDANIDLSVLAYSYIYFDSLVAEAAVDKVNRKLVAGVTLLLAAKMNDVRGQDLRHLINKIEDNFRIARRELIQYEVPMLVALQFGLHLPQSDLNHQYRKVTQR